MQEPKLTSQVHPRQQHSLEELKNRQDQENYHAGFMEGSSSRAFRVTLRSAYNTKSNSDCKDETE